MGAAVDPIASMVGGLFGGGGGSAPTPPTPPPPPPAMPPAYIPPIGVVGGAQPGSAGAAGFGSTVITGPQGLKQPESTTNKQLLGG